MVLIVVCTISVVHTKAQNQGMIGSSGIHPASLLSAAASRPADDGWAPPDIDQEVPPVLLTNGCSLTNVVGRAGERVEELVSNLDRFTATEHVQHQSVKGGGKLGKPETRNFNYVVSIGPGNSNYLSVQELRTSARDESIQFPDQISTEGTPSLVLVFHPLYARDFDMKCEGLGSWRGRPAWQVRFEQRPDRKNHLSSVVVKQKLYDVRLRGRAWILADSFEVARLETDLAETSPGIKLRLEHIDVEYRPVQFTSRHTELWLPATAELYLDFSGRRFYRRHSFSDFTLFSVDVKQQFADVIQR
jgi:hypothetical protein